MKKGTRIVNGIIGIALIGAIFTIYITEYYCNVRHELADTSEKYSHEHSQKHQDIESLGDENHDHEAVEHHHDSDKTGKHSHSGKSKDGNCCKTVTSSFYSALNKPVNVKYSFTKTLSAVYTPFQNVLFNNWIEPSPSDLFCYKSPPPKIPDIRVFIHSFII